MARYGEEKRWYQSPWVWGGAGCCFGCVVLPIVLVVVAGGAGFAFFQQAAGGLKEGAIEYLEQTPEAIEALGEPVEAGWQIRGSFNVENDRGEADFAFPVSGPDGEGWLEVVAEKAGGEWYYRSLALEVDGTGERIFIPTPDAEPLREMPRPSVVPPEEPPLTPEAPPAPDEAGEMPETVEEM